MSFRFAIFFCLFPFLSVLGQSNAERLYEKAKKTKSNGQEKEAIRLYLKAFEEAKKTDQFHLTGSISASLAAVYYAKGEYGNASTICENALQLLTDHEIKKDSVWFKLYAAQAPSYKNQYLSQKAIESYYLANKVLAQVPEIEKQLPLYVGYHYYNQGVFWLKIHDVSRAKTNFEKALNLGLQITNNELVIDATLSLGSIYSYESNIHKGLSLMNRAFTLLKKDPATKPLDLARAQLYTSSMYKANSQYDEAAIMLESIIQAENRLNSSPDGRNVFAQAVLQRIELPRRESNMDRLKMLGDINTLPKHLQVQYFISLAIAKGNNTDWKGAIDAYSKALELVELKYEKQWKSIDMIKSFSAFVGLSEAYYQNYLFAHDQVDFDQSLSTVKKCLEVADEIRKGQTSFESKLFFSEKHFKEYKRAINLLNELYEINNSKEDLVSLFKIAEDSKSYMMKLSQINNGFKRNAKEDSLSLKLSAYKSYIAYLRNNNTPTETIRTFEEKADFLLGELSVLSSSRRNQKASGDVAVLSELKLADNQLYVNYIIDDETLLIICLTKEGLRTSKTSFERRVFENQIAVLNKSLTTPPRNFEGFDQMEACEYLYDLLIKTLPYNVEDYERLAINPDNELLDFSFDILRNKGTDRFLIEDLALSYVTSASDLLKNKLPKLSEECNIFLPFTRGSSDMFTNLQPLRFSFQKAKGIKGDFFVDEAATKEAFYNKLNESNSVTMISTHAYAQEEEPYLIFNDEDASHSRLYASELPYREVNSPLIILNACEGNLGRKVNGMGLLSLSESFRIAGGKSVLGSMWLADESSTAIISSLFYRYIMKGFTRDVALQKAKLDYWETEEGKQNDTPFYWAHLQLIGESSALKANSLYQLLYALLALLVLTLLLKIVFSKRAEI